MALQGSAAGLARARDASAQRVAVPASAPERERSRRNDAASALIDRGYVIPGRTYRRRFLRPQKIR
jgi:hypothetical protein